MSSRLNLLSKLGTLSGKVVQAAILSAAIFVLLGAGDPATRFNEIGHQMMCICGCNQIGRAHV